MRLSGQSHVHLTNLILPIFLVNTKYIVNLSYGAAVPIYSTLDLPLLQLQYHIGLAHGVKYLMFVCMIITY